MLGTGDPTQYIQIQEMMAAKEPYEKLWQGAVKFHRYYDKWMNGPLLEVNAEEVEEEVSGDYDVTSAACFINFILYFRFTSGLLHMYTPTGPVDLEDSVQADQVVRTSGLQGANASGGQDQRQTGEV